MKNWKYINGAEGVKIGNFTPNYRYKDFLITNPEGYEYIVFLKDGHTVAYRGTTSKAQAEDWCDWHDAKTGKPTGNSKTGNDTPEEYAKRPPKIVGGNSLPEELEKDVEKKDKEKVREVEELKKTGNEASTVSEYNAEIQRLTKKAEQLRRMGQGKSAMDIEKQIEKLGKELREYTGNKVGNRMSGNAGFDLRDPDPQGFLEAKARAAAQKRQREEEEKKKRIDGIYKDKDGNKWRVHYRIGPDVRSDTQYHIVRADYSDIAKLRDRIPDGFVKIGNSEDDKFAYVMREFDEGKLKTPDGKVVTDPAQAKAIAYSESKKTENGLERARNAMAKNKNVGNSTRVVDQETIGGIRTYVFYDDSDDVYYVSDKGQGPLGNIFDNPSFKTKDEAKRYIKQRIS